ncbi:MAG TPA: glycosyltransferase, partial [Patescibacteria group bacterium]|nr:glycosyltransferase [Patescibacteria group bacterium]
IIASDIGGNPELVQDDYNGLLVAYNNQEAWVNAFRRLWSNEKLRERLASSPLVKLDVFSFDTMIKETLKVIYS